MFTISRKQHKIFDSIIGFIFNAINRIKDAFMMNDFFGKQVSSEVLFHHISMFQYTTISIRRMIFIFDKHYVSIRSFMSASCPFSRFFTFTKSNQSFIPRFFTKMGNPIFFFRLWSMVCSYKTIVSTFSTTILSPSQFNLAWSCFKLLSTQFTFSNHKCTSLKRAAFGGLQETIKFPHLLTARFLDIKYSFPVSNYSIPQGA